MSLSKVLTVVSCFAFGGVVLTVPRTAKAWYAYENASICTFVAGSPSIGWSVVGGWLANASSQTVKCPLSETTATPIHSSTGLWVYGWKGSTTNLSAKVCTMYYASVGGSCGTPSDTSSMPVGSFELGPIDLSPLYASDGSAFIDVGMDKSTEINSYWIQG